MCLPQAEPIEDGHAPCHDEGGEGEAEGFDRAVQRCEPSPRRGLEDTENHDRQPQRRQHRAHAVETRPRVGSCHVVDPGDGRDDTDRHHDFADEDDPPGELGRGEAAENRPDGDSGARRSAEDSVGGDPIGPLVVAGNESGHGRHHQRGSDAFQDRPADGEGWNRPRCRGEGGTRGVDHQADREGSSPADDVGDLPTGEHQSGHHQGIEGDDPLNRRHGRVEVLDELADGDVHDRLIEHHQELGDRQDDEGAPLEHRRTVVLDSARRR